MVKFTSAELSEILDEYIAKIVPAMIRRNYHLILVKGGAEYPHLPEQSHFAHIMNGVFGLVQFMKYVVTQEFLPPHLDVTVFRQALAAFTVHEVHKDRTVERLGSSEFSIPLKSLRAEYNALGLGEFATVDDHTLREANTHKRSTKHGDALLGEPSAMKLWLLVRIADTFASVKSPEEAISSLKGYLSDFSQIFAPNSTQSKYTLFYHHIGDVRGVLTNAIHQAVAAHLGETGGMVPLLYFATGTLYLGPVQPIKMMVQSQVSDIAGRVLSSLATGEGGGAARDGLRRQKFDFEPYVYALASVQNLLDVIHEDSLTAKPDAKIAIDEINGLVAKRKELSAEWLSTVEQRFGILLFDPKEHKTFNELWYLVRRYLLYVDTLLRDLAPATNRLDWFLKVFEVPETPAKNLRQEYDIWARGGVGKYVLIIAYHFLRGADFVNRKAEGLPPEEVLERLHQKVSQAMEGEDTQAGRQVAVAALGLREELEVYLWENLTISSTPGNQLETDSLAGYSKVKSKGHSGSVCSLCNRNSDYTDELRTGILDDFGRVFSNRVLPAKEAPQGNRLWCPICQLEFILRKLAGMGLPNGAHYKNSRRIFLYVLPTFSFTPEHIKLFGPMLHPFQQVTSFPVRDYGKAWGMPHYWLENRHFDPDWIEDMYDVLTREGEKITGWGGQNFVGERLSLASASIQPHYYLITWEKAARDSESDDARVATRTEAWAKGLFLATVLSGLTSCKIYMTERPYLPVSDPAELKATITLDSAPPVLEGLLGAHVDTVTLYGREKGLRSGLERSLDLCAALWTVTADVHAPNRSTKDKYIAGRLNDLNTSPLAGASFYKEYARLNDGQTPYPTLATACEILLHIQAEIHGGELMDLVEQIAQKSLQIAIPSGASGRGKARRYELIFREGISAMRRAQQAIPEMRVAALGKSNPTPESITELKRLTAGTLLKGLERRNDSGRGDIFIRSRGYALGQLTGEFVDILVDELYLGRAGGSMARLLRLENQLADGIYYYTDRNLPQVWEVFKQEKAAREAAAQSSQSNKGE